MRLLGDTGKNRLAALGIDPHSLEFLCFGVRCSDDLKSNV